MYNIIVHNNLSLVCDQLIILQKLSRYVWLKANQRCLAILTHEQLIQLFKVLILLGFSYGSNQNFHRWCVPLM